MSHDIASVGLTGHRARAAGHEVKSSLLPLDRVPRAVAARDTRALSNWSRTQKQTA